MPLFFRASPRTPLRALGIIALDTLHVLRYGRRLRPARVCQLALFLDFEGYANAACDGKHLCAAEYRSIEQRLETAGLRSCAEEYLARLRTLETGRPPVGGDHRRFEAVRAYREAVARLSVETAAAIALNVAAPERGASVRGDDADVETLFRILMQCQIIDDVLDYRADARAGLPSFLTAMASLPRALDLTAGCSRSYASGSSGTFPLRVALDVVSWMSRAVVGVGRRWSLIVASSRLSTSS